MYSVSCRRRTREPRAEVTSCVGLEETAPTTSLAGRLPEKCKGEMTATLGTRSRVCEVQVPVAWRGHRLPPGAALAAGGLAQDPAVPHAGQAFHPVCTAAPQEQTLG